MRTSIIRPVLVTLAVLLSPFFVRGTPGFVLQAQSEPQLEWSDPIRVSQSGNWAHAPFIVADPEGTLHLVWSESVEQPTNILNSDTIFYASNSNGVWTAPNDIFAAPDGGQAIVNRLRSDRSGYLHILWVSRPGIVYAMAPPGQAGSARMWLSNRLAENAWIADFALAPDGTVHLVYILDRQGIYYTQSVDNGKHWLPPVAVWFTPDTNHSGTGVRIEMGGDGTLHVAWGVSAAAKSWNPTGIAYARSTDNGVTWTTTLDVQEGDNFPNIGIDSLGGIHLVWDNPADTTVGRGHAWSTDGGETWHIVERVFAGYRGSTLWPVMAQDSAGTLHLVFSANGPTAGSPQVWHSVWQNDRWGAPDLITPDMYGGEGPSMAISEGNRLHAVWFSYIPKEYGIWYATAQSPAPWIPPQPILAASPTPTVPPTDTPAPTPSVTQETLAAAPDRDRVQTEPVQVRPPWWPVGVAIVPVLLLILLVSVSRTFRRRNRRDLL